MRIPDAVRTVVDTAPFAHLTTLNADGGPQVTVVWVDIEGDDFVVGHMGERRKTKNVRHDPRVALSMLAKRPSASVASASGARRNTDRSTAAQGSAARIARARRGSSGSRAPIRSTVSPARASPATHRTTAGWSAAYAAPMS